MNNIFKKINYKKIIPIVIAVFMILPIIPKILLPVWGADTIHILSHDVGANPIGIAYGGSQIHTSDGYYLANGVEYPAYCLDPSKPGAGEVGAYDVIVSDSITDPKVYGIVLAGFPYKTAAELGVGNDWDANLATKLALRAYINGWNVNSFSVYGTDSSGEYAQVLTAIKNIYNAGVQNTIIPPAPSVTVTANGGSNTVIDEGDVFSKTYAVTANVTIKSYTVTLPSNAPAGTQITDIDGNPKTTFATGEKFKIIIPKASVTSSGSIKLDISGEVANQTLLYGAAVNSANQDYVITGAPVTFKDANAYAEYSVEETTTPAPTTPVEPTEPTTTPPTTTDTPPTTEPAPPPPGKLDIIKLDADTNKPLPGAVFEIRNSAGSVVAVSATDGSGKILQSLESGFYSVTEITPPTGYALDVNPHKDNIVIRSDETTTVTFTNKALATLEITKVDADTGELLAGATVRVAKDGGSDFVDVTTNSLGVAVLKDIPDGTYTVTEIIAPAGYALDGTPQIIVLEAGKTAAITLKDKVKPGIVVKKYDENTGLVLAGAEFSIAKMGGQIIYEGMTDENGEIRVENLDSGWYAVTEIAAPAGYLKATESKNVYLDDSKSVTVKFDNRLRPSLKIVKLDADTNQPLAGAKFCVKATEGDTVSEYVTDDSGTIVIHDLDEKIYSIWESDAPSGYLCDGEHKDIQLAWGTTKTLVFTDKSRPKLEIVKLDETTKQPLAGAKFRVTATESSTVSEYITNDQGRILIDNLNEEIYSIEEISAPAGYLLDPQHKDIKLEAGQTKTVIFTDKARPKIEIQKIDSVTKQPLTGATFRLTRTDNLTVSEYTTDSTGKILVDNLDEAVYTVEEATPPNGYISETQKKDIQLRWGETSTLVFENTRKPTLVIAKVDGLSYRPIPSTFYRIQYESANGGIITLGTYKTDQNGKIIIPKVEPGWYIITEVLPASGYAKASNPVTRKYLAPGENAYLPDEIAAANIPFVMLENLSDNSDAVNYSSTDGGLVLQGESDGTGTQNIAMLGETVTSGDDYIDGEAIINYPLNSIVLKKENAVTGELLPGAIFELRQVTGEISGTSGTVIGHYVTNNSGIIVITGLDAGTGYIVEEVMPPENYLLSENSQQQAWLKADGTSVVELTFSNYPYGNLLVIKVDATTGKPLAGARFKVTDGTGAVAGSTNGEFVTDANGQFLVSNLKPGSYVVTELEAPQDYAIDTTPQTIHVGTDGKTYTLNFKDQPFGGLIITKRDSVTKEPLAGAQFQITDSHGAFVGDSANGLYTTDATGTIKLDHIKTGAYIVTEVKAPTGYLTDNISQTVQVEYGTIKSVDFYNQLLGGLLIKKYNSVTKEPLADAIFKVTDIQGVVVGTSDGLYRTDETGTIYIYGLKPGGYRIQEMQAPSGFLLDNTAQTVQILDEKMYSLEFFDQPVGSLQIRKFDSQSKQPLANAKFKVTTQDGRFIGDYTTDATGYIQIPNLLPNFYVVEEVSAPSGYLADSTPQTIELKVYNVAVSDFFDNPMSSIIIKKFDSVTKAPLMGARFKITKKSGEIVGDYNTDSNGLIQIDNLEPGWYSATEISAPMGYKTYDVAQDFEITNTKTVTLEFPNEKLTSLIIKKIDEFAGVPLIGAQFSVEKQNGERVGEYTTDNTGLINIPTLDPDWYVVRETKAPEGYQLNETPQTVEVKTAVPTIVTFTDRPLSGIEIIKTDAVTNAPLSGATFTIERDNGERIGVYKTDISGKIIVPGLSEGTYVVSEMIAPMNYILDETPKTVIVKANKLTTVEFQNNPKSGLQIVKMDANTKNPLKGAKFTIYRMDGGVVGNYETDGNGVIIIGQLESGWYKVAENKAPDGYLPDDTPQDIQVTSGQFIKLTFEDKPLASLQIKKINEVTGAPLAGAQFNVTKQNGEYIGDYTTDNDGFINIPILAPGWYVVTETRQPSGYILDATPKTVEVKTSVPTVVTFSNKPMSGLHILKLDSVTREPLEGVEFLVSKMNGERIGTFKTDKSGSIYIADLESGWYVVQEIKGLDKYHIDPTPRNIEIKWGNPVVMEWTNAPYSELLIKKTAKGTDTPLANVEFMVTKFNGEQVGTFMTDSSGQITIEGLDEGSYFVKETKAVTGFELDETAYEVRINDGKRTTLELENTPLASVIIRKIDSETGKGIYGVKFLLYDGLDNPIGQFISDDQGYVWIDRKLPEGKYKLRELETVAGYVLDDMPRTFYVSAGQTTEITFENSPAKGQILITKRSADYNEITEFAAGSLLSGATFEIVDTTGNVVDKVTSDSKGVAASKPLPFGVYFIREIVAPKFYAVNTKEIWAEIKHNGDIVKFEVLDASVTLDVTIRKAAQSQISPGDTLIYDIFGVQNNSSVTLQDFYIHDRLPTDATRPVKIITGTYSE
ncbi:MAG: SpaA isopeptide-forming pilin-related protein, partial [Oscillospiraceae bacterium]|nr:SpaA isopeptide-forming pilin-related protein [Oscillospiraceae bacterium]